MARKTRRTPLFPGDYAMRMGSGSKDVTAWYVDDACNLKTARVIKVRVSRLRGSCDTYETGIDYADLEDGRKVSSVFLFPTEGYTKPQLAVLRDDMGSFRQWVAIPRGKPASKFGIVLMKDITVPG